jgi:hypothetical protein
VATEATIKRCFDRLRVVHRPYLATETDYVGLLEEWIGQLADYSEAAVIDATEALVLHDKFPALNEVIAAVQKAARDIKSEREFAWGKDHPEDDPTNIDPVGRQRLIDLMHGVLKRAGEGEHHHPWSKAAGETPADGIARCPICSRHDHTDGSAYCPACQFDDEGIVLGDPGKVVSICRLGCDHGFLEIWVDERNVELPAGVMGKTMAVKPCPRCNPDAYEAWQNGTWGEQGRKKKSKRVNASARDEE